MHFRVMNRLHMLCVLSFNFPDDKVQLKMCLFYKQFKNNMFVLSFIDLTFSLIQSQKLSLYSTVIRNYCDKSLIMILKSHP